MASEAKLTNGEVYTGNQLFAGNGIQRWCAICSVHRPVGGGHNARVLGGSRWVCALHDKGSANRKLAGASV